MSASKRTILIIVLAIITGVFTGFWFGGLQDDMDSATVDPSPIQGFILPTPRQLGIPELVQGDGSVFDRSDLEGRWSLVFFGYTNCPDVCPMTLNTVAAAKRDVDSFPQVIFISVDPNRDDAKLVGEYVKYFDDSFIGVTGEQKLLDAIAIQMSVVAEAEKPAEPGGRYLVSHSSSLLLVDPQVRLAAILRHPHSVESINQAIGHVIGNFE